MDAEKDRLGDKLRDLEHGRENKYFADRDRELLEKLRRESMPVACPSCGANLKPLEDGPLKAYGCEAGHGLWLAAADLSILADPANRRNLEQLLGRAAKAKA